MMSAPDKGIPEDVTEGAKCIAVIPHELKGGLAVFSLAQAAIVHQRLKGGHMLGQIALRIEN